MALKLLNPITLCCSHTMSDSEDNATFKHFFIYCLNDGDRLHSVGAVSKHRVARNEPKDGLSMLCGECGDTFTKIKELTDHINRKGFSRRRSQIAGYDKGNFDPRAYIASKSKQKQVASTAAREHAKAEAASQRRQAATRLALKTSALRQNVHMQDFERGTLATPAALASAALTSLHPLSTSTQQIPLSPIFPLPPPPQQKSIMMVHGTFDSSLTNDTNTEQTSAAPQTTQALFDSISDLLRPATQGTSATTVADTELDDTLPASQELHTTQEISQQEQATPSTGAVTENSAPPSVTNPQDRAQTSVASASAVATIGPSHRNQATSPLHVHLPTTTASLSASHSRQYSTSSSSSTTTETALATHINWLTALLRLTVQAGQLPPSAELVDQNFRPALINSGIWPRDTPMNVSLGQLLEQLVGQYPKHIYKRPHSR